MRNLNKLLTLKHLIREIWRQAVQFITRDLEIKFELFENKNLKIESNKTKKTLLDVLFEFNFFLETLEEFDQKTFSIYECTEE